MIANSNASFSRPLWVALLTVSTVSFAGHAAAHLGSTKYVEVVRTGDGANVSVDIDVVDVAYELDVAQEESAILDREADVRAWLTRGITLTASGAACDVSSQPLSFRTRDALRYVSVTLSYHCDAPLHELTLRDDTVFDDDARHEAIVRVASDTGASATFLRAGHRAMVLEDQDIPSSLWAQAGRFFIEGAIHLFTGYDHILFLLTLLLVAGEAAARDGVKRAAKDVAIVVTGFTVGHSITLIAAALDVVVLPSQLVESAIALSIVIVAAWNLYKPEKRSGLPWVAAVFGLIHGFGFSSVLRELVLPTEGRIVSLLAFNVGIELAQLSIVLVVLGPLAWAASKPWYRRVVVQMGSGAIAIVAGYWFVTRALGIA